MVLCYRLTYLMLQFLLNYISLTLLSPKISLLDKEDGNTIGAEIHDFLLVVCECFIICPKQWACVFLSHFFTLIVADNGYLCVSEPWDEHSSSFYISLLGESSSPIMYVQFNPLYVLREASEAMQDQCWLSCFLYQQDHRQIHQHLWTWVLYL